MTLPLRTTGVAAFVPTERTTATAKIVILTMMLLRTPEASAVPPNDDFEAAFDLGSMVSASIEDSLEGSTVENGESLLINDPRRGSVWFQWTSPVTGLVRLTLSSEPFGEPHWWSWVLSVMQGDALEQIDELYRHSHWDGDVFDRFLWQATAGERYWFRLEGYEMPPYRLELDASGEGVNQQSLIENAVSLGSAVAVTVRDSAEGVYLDPRLQELPELAYLSELSAPYTGALWWQWTAPDDGLVYLTSHRTPSPLPWKGIHFAGVFTGTSMDELVSANLNGSAGTFQATKGETYSIAARWRGQPREFVFNLDQVRLPNNRTPDQAKDLGDGVFAWDTRLPRQPSAWWRWRSPADGRVDFHNLDLEISTDGSVGGLVSLDSRYFEVERGRTYHIAATVWNGASDLTLKLHHESGFSQRTSMGAPSPDLVMRPPEGAIVDGLQTHWFEVTSMSADVPSMFTYYSRGETPLLRLYEGGSLDELEGITPDPWGPKDDRYQASITFDASRTTIPAFGMRVREARHFVLEGIHVVHEAALVAPPRGLFTPGQADSFEWEAPEDGVARIRCEGPAPITIDVPGIGQREDHLEFQVTAGASYRISLKPPNAELIACRLEVDLLPVARPVNDDFANAILLDASGDVSFHTELMQSTLEEAEDAAPSLGSLWWQWTAPVSGTLSVDTDDGVQIGLFQGEGAISNLEILEQGTGVPNVVAGQNVWIQLIGAARLGPSIAEVRLEFDPAWPDHSEPEEALSLEHGIQRINASAGSLWWHLAAVRDEDVRLGLVRLRSSGEPPARWTVYESTTAEFSEETVLVLSDGDGVGFRVREGAHYWIELFTEGPSRRPAMLHMTTSTGSWQLPGADNATPVAADGRFEAAIFAEIERIDTYWYAWTAPDSGIAWLRFDPARVDQYIWPAGWDVFEGENPQSLRHLDEAARTSADVRMSHAVLFRAESGKTYYLRSTPIQGHQLALGSFMVTIEPTAANDVIEAAFDLGAASTFSFPGRQLYGSRHVNEPPVISLDEQTLWWSWTAPQNGVLTLRQETLPDSVITAYAHADRYDSLRFLDQGGTVHVPVKRNERYSIRLSSPQSLTREFVLHGELTPDADEPTETPYAIWAGEAGLQEADQEMTSDPDDDGWPNLLEYLLFSHPLRAGDVPELTFHRDDDSLLLEYRRREDSAAVRVEITGNLLSWEAAEEAEGFSELIEQIEEGHELVRIALPLTDLANSARFLRIVGSVSGGQDSPD